MTITEFTKHYADLFAIKFPTTKFTIVDDSTIESSFPDDDVTISVVNAYKEYQAEPNSLQEILTKYLTVASELYVSKEKLSIDNIVPIIKPNSFVHDVQGAYEKYNDQLIIAYAEDKKEYIRYITDDDIKSLSVNKDLLKQTAIKNLDKLLTSIQRQDDDGVYMVTAGGDYEASIILLDKIFTKELLPVNGDFVITIPNRDMLLVTGSNDKAGIARIREIAKKSFETGSYQVSEYLYKWNGRVFEKYN